MSERRWTEERCPCCGWPVRVVSSGEGTSHYEPLPSAEHLEALREIQQAWDTEVEAANEARRERDEWKEQANLDLAEGDKARARYERLREALERIAVGERPDGTYNLSREAWEQIARAALKEDHAS